MPIFRFSRAFSIAGGVKAFLHLESGVTRGAVPDAARAKELRRVVREQRKELKSQGREILRLKTELEQHEEQDEDEGQDEDLKNTRQRLSKTRGNLKSKKREIFRLRNELRAAKEKQAVSASQGPPALQTTGNPETGALPDFIIVGAQKCGTTSLYDLLTRHPHVERAALKELNYFDEHFDEGVEWYRSQFPPPKWKDGRRSITGEATPRYLFHPPVPERVARTVPQARMIVLLRNPVDRAYSHYHHGIRHGRKTQSFEEAVEAALVFEEAVEAGERRPLGKEDEAPEHGHRTSVGYTGLGFLKRGIYVDQLQRWSKFFSDEQMLVLKSEDFFERELDTMKLVMDFLDLPDWESEAEPEASRIRNKSVYTQPMDPAIRRRLEDYFRPHNQRLYESLSVDFGW